MEAARLELGDHGNGPAGRDRDGEAQAAAIVLEPVPFRRAGVVRALAHAPTAMPVAEREVIEPRRRRPVRRNDLRAPVLAREGLDRPMREADADVPLGRLGILHPCGQVAPREAARGGGGQEGDPRREFHRLGPVEKTDVRGRVPPEPLPERLRREAVVVPGNDPPPDPGLRSHRVERLPHDLVRGRLGIEEIAGDQHMCRAVRPRRLNQRPQDVAARGGQNAAHLLGQIAEPAAKMEVGGVDEAEFGHAEQVSGKMAVSAAGGPSIRR